MDGYIRKIEQSFKDKIIPSTINRFCFDFYFIKYRELYDLSTEELEMIDFAMQTLQRRQRATDDVEVDTFWEIFGTLGMNIKETKQEIMDIIQEIDDHGDGVFDTDELMAMIRKKIYINSKMAKFEQQFRIFDKNGDGKITPDELKEVLIELGEEVTDQDVMDMIQRGDTNGDGTLTLEEFASMMMMQDDTTIQQLVTY